MLRVADVERSLAWYTETLGLSSERVEEWRAGTVPFPSVRVDAATVIDLFPAGPEPDAAGRANLDHLCLVVAPCDLWAAALAAGLTVLDGPAPRWGALGTGTSIYVQDPDGNTVELRHYG